MTNNQVLTLKPGDQIRYFGSAIGYHGVYEVEKVIRQYMGLFYSVQTRAKNGITCVFPANYIESVI